MFILAIGIFHHIGVIALHIDGKVSQKIYDTSFYIAIGSILSVAVLGLFVLLFIV